MWGPPPLAGSPLWKAVIATVEAVHPHRLARRPRARGRGRVAERVGRCLPVPPPWCRPLPGLGGWQRRRRGRGEGGGGRAQQRLPPQPPPPPSVARVAGGDSWPRRAGCSGWGGEAAVAATPVPVRLIDRSAPDDDDGSGHGGCKGGGAGPPGGHGGGDTRWTVLAGSMAPCSPLPGRGERVFHTSLAEGNVAGTAGGSSTMVRLARDGAAGRRAGERLQWRPRCRRRERRAGRGPVATAEVAANDARWGLAAAGVGGEL